MTDATFPAAVRSGDPARFALLTDAMRVAGPSVPANFNARGRRACGPGAYDARF